MHKMILAAGLFLSWGAAHALTVDVTRLIGVVIGGFIAALVVGDVMPPTAITRWAAVIAECMRARELFSFADEFDSANRPSLAGGRADSIRQEVRLSGRLCGDAVPDWARMQPVAAYLQRLRP